MATVVHVDRRDLFGDIGRAIGGGFGEGIEDVQDRKDAAARSRLMGELLDEVKDAPDARSALALAGTERYSGLFKDVQELQTFGQLVKQVHERPDKDVKKFDVVVDGTQKQVFLNEDQTREISNAKDQSAALREILGLEGDVSLGTLDEQDDPFIDLVDSSGRTVRRTRESAFDPAEAKKQGLFTADDFDRSLALRKEGRLERAGQEGEDSGGFSSDAERRAAGFLESRGEEVTDTAVRTAMFKLEQVDKFQPRLASSYNMEMREGTPIATALAQQTGGAERFAIATTVMPELAYEGLTATQAFRAARAIADASTVMGTDEIGNPQQKGAKTQVPTFAGKEEAKSFVDRLDNSTDIGTVFKVGDKFAVYYGKDKKGRPLIEFVEVGR